ncbi:MAG: cytochrome c [Neisseriaceae bacterium]|nr:cytochrome c [Neisseriaceae bacterium]MBP6861325.1 cytochrome c [Neisseriaceae bacterium]
MKKIYLTLSAIVVVGVAAAYGGSHAIMASRQQAIEPKLTASADVVARGQYVAKSADCFACHSVPGGKDYAGGLAMQTPVGAIYSTNITPDPETGIGGYSLTQFANAVKHGVRHDGAPLYPAMPYPSYTIMPDEDIEAMYAYFMTAVEPVKQVNQPSTLPSVMSMRWPVAYWQALFAPARTFTANAEWDEDVKRGAYLVEGPGHCGACHTPRGVAYQEQSMSMADDDSFLSGAVVDGWRAKSLRGEGNGLGEWTEDDIVQFLKTGRTDKIIAFGAMADVVEHSTQFMTPADLRGMAKYLKSLPPTSGRPEQRPTQEDKTTQALLDGTDTSRGALLYTENCTVCHRADGKGVARIFPALDDNSAVVANNAQSVIQVTLEGGRMASTPHDKMAFTMPAFNKLSDEDVKDIVNFVRTGWTNDAPRINTQDVTEIRRFLEKKSPHYLGEKQ